MTEEDLVTRLREALEKIEEISHRRSLPITSEINDLASEALRSIEGEGLGREGSSVAESAPTLQAGRASDAEGH